MLAKIQNINTNRSALRNKGRTSNFEQYLTKPFVNNGFGKDSISFSPAAIYLSSIKWQLNEIVYESAEKVFLDVFIDGYEFRTEFDFANFYSSPKQHFEILHKTVDGMNIIKTSAQINYFKDFVEVSEVFTPNQIYGIDELFERFHSSAREFQSEQIISDKTELNSYLDELESEVAEEFQVIMNQMYTFVEKLKRFDVQKYFEFQNQAAGKISLEKFSAKYG